MKNNSFLHIRIIIITTIYIVCALSGALSGVLCNELYGALLGDCRAPHSTPKKNTVFTILHRIKTLSTIHKKEGFISYIQNNMGSWIGFYLPFWPGSSAHQERKANNEIRKNRTFYGHLCRS